MLNIRPVLAHCIISSKSIWYLLLPLLFPLVLRVLQHLFFPQVKEVGGVCVELKRLLVVIPTETNPEKVMTINNRLLMQSHVK